MFSTRFAIGYRKQRVRILRALKKNCPKDTTQNVLPRRHHSKELPKRYHSQGTAQKTPLKRNFPKDTTQKNCLNIPLTRHCPKDTTQKELPKHTTQKTAQKDTTHKALPKRHHSQGTAQKTLAKRYNSKSKELNLISEDQNGFKKCLCTTHTLLLPTQGITHRFNCHTATIALFLDKDQACDEVRTTGHISTHLAQQECQLAAHSCLNNRSFAEVHRKGILSPRDAPSWQQSPGAA